MLREHLCEDGACSVEDFLFSRNLTSPETIESEFFHDCMTERCLAENDFDGLLFVFQVSVYSSPAGPVCYTGTW